MQSGKSSERDPSAPDISVLVQIGDVRVRTRVAPDTFADVFDHPIAIPLEAVPPTGVELRVVDVDQDIRDGELIGLVRLSRAQIERALVDGRPVVTLSDEGVRRIELTISPYAPLPAAPGVQVDVRRPPTAFRTQVRAGELVTIATTGTYSVASDGEQIGVMGYRSGIKRNYNLPDFGDANHGETIAYVGDPAASSAATSAIGWTDGHVHAALVVGRCAAVVSPVPGPVFVGVNDRDTSNNRGAFEAAVRVSLPTVEQWKAGGEQACAEP